MKFRLKKQINHLRFLLNIRNNWNFWTSSNSGIYANKVSIQTGNNRLLLTYPELLNHIKRTKNNIQKIVKK